jgi:leucyl/phenylalanyl-tRNA---protein transferase
MAIALDLLIRAYRRGVFPMADARDHPDSYWVEPKKRAILPLSGLQVSKSLAKTIRQDRFQVTGDQAFPRVIATCAAFAQDRQETWINTEIEDAFLALHEQGRAHSVECWRDGELVGGLYGMAMGRAFFGESMFSRTTDASKVALVWLVARLRLGGFELLDCQFMTDHLASLGAIEISQKRYLQLLDSALAGCSNVPDQVTTVDSPSASPPDSSSSSASGSGAGAGRDGAWGRLDGVLLGVDPDRCSGAESAVGALGKSSGLGSSPGKLILHSLTQTS